MIRLENIERVFLMGGESVRALDGINLEIQPGSYVSLMGPSGSGKSTLLNVIGLLDQPTAGRYFLSGREVTTLDDDLTAELRLRNIGFVFQSFHLIPRLTALDNIMMPMILAGVPPAERRTRARELLRRFGLSHRETHRPRELSGGQLQRIAIARAICMKPEIVLADEPTGNLDQTSGLEVIEVLEELRDEGITLIIVTHDQELGARANRHIRLVDGKVAEDRET